MERQQTTAKSYTILYIVLFTLLFGCVLVTCHDLKGTNNQYQTITVHEGDTLWSLGAKYKGTMSTPQFVSWVETNNHLSNRNDIKVGQEITLPIKIDSSSQHLQVADGSFHS